MYGVGGSSFGLPICEGYAGGITSTVDWTDKLDLPIPIDLNVAPQVSEMRLQTVKQAEKLSVEPG